MKKTFSGIYAFFEPLVFASLHGWHRRFVIDGEQNIPEGPVMLIANHQNGMEDPLACCVTATRQCHFLTRADIFAKPSIDKLLRSMNMIPVYRPRDRKSDARDRNADSFARARARLAKGCIVALFPEGNHGNRHHLRKFKTGMARIGLEALDTWKDDPNMPDDIQVVPVGLDYQNYTDFRSELRLEYGQPFSLNSFLETYKTDPQEGVKQATNRARIALLNHMVHINQLDRHDTIMELRPIWRHLTFGKNAWNADLGEVLRGFQRFARPLEQTSEAKFLLIQTALKNYNDASAAIGLPPHQADLASRSTGWKLGSLLLLLLSLPLFLFGAVSNLLPALLTRHVVNNKVRDPHFKSSFGFAVPAFAAPLWWLIIGLATVAIAGWLWVPAVLIAVIGCGILALPWRDRALRLFRAMRWASARRKNQHAVQSAQEALDVLKSHCL